MAIIRDIPHWSYLKSHKKPLLWKDQEDPRDQKISKEL